MTTMADLDELALALPQTTKDVSDDGRPSYRVHGKLLCVHRGLRRDALDLRPVHRPLLVIRTPLLAELAQEHESLQLQDEFFELVEVPAHAQAASSSTIASPSAGAASARGGLALSSAPAISSPATSRS